MWAAMTACPLKASGVDLHRGGLCHIADLQDVSGADVLAYIQDGTPVTPHKNVSGVGYGGIPSLLATSRSAATMDPVDSGNAPSPSGCFMTISRRTTMIWPPCTGSRSHPTGRSMATCGRCTTRPLPTWVSASLVFTSESGTATAYDLSTVADDTGYIRANGAP